MLFAIRNAALVALPLLIASPAHGLDCPPARDLWPAGAGAAEERARACQTEAPEDPERALALSQILAWQDRHEEALSLADHALGLAPADPELQAWRLRLLGWLGRFDEAQTTLDALEPASDPEHRALALVRADLALWREEWGAADRAYSSYLAAWPDDRGASRSLAMARLRDGKEDEARPLLATLCAEDDPLACEALRDIQRSGVALLLQAGPIASSGPGAGWRGRAGVELPASERLRLRAGLELQQRLYGGTAARDTLVDGAATWQTLPWLSLEAGAGFGLRPSFSPEWNVYAEAGVGLGGGFTLFAKLWHIEFSRTGVDVVSPAIHYEGRWAWTSLRLWRSFDPAGDGLALLGQVGVPLVWELDLTLGVGGGDKADYLTVRDSELGVERHLVGLAGLAWTPMYELQLRLDYVGRREWSGDARLMRHEILFGLMRRW